MNLPDLRVSPHYTPLNSAMINEDSRFKWSQVVALLDINKERYGPAERLRKIKTKQKLFR